MYLGEAEGDRCTYTRLDSRAAGVTKNLQNRIGKLYGRMHRANGRPVYEMFRT